MTVHGAGTLFDQQVGAVSGVVIEPRLEPAQLGLGTLDQLLARSADVTILVDARTGAPLRRWYDADHSNLDLPGQPEIRIIRWVHPDDLPNVLDALAHVAREGGTKTTSVRMHPDRDESAERSLLVSIHDVQASVEAGLLVQAWLVDSDRAITGHPDDTAAMTSLAAAVPVGLQMRSANGSITFENERFTTLAATARAALDSLVESRLLDTRELVEDLEVDGRSLRLHVVPTVDDKGRAVLAVASLEDVTSLRAAQGLFRAVFDGSPAATAIVDLDGRLTQVNEALAMILGCSVDELTGRRFDDLAHPDDLTIDHVLRDEVLTGTRSGYQIEKRYRHRAGHDVWAELSVAAVRPVGRAITHFVVTVDDITARKAMLGSHEDEGDLAYWASRDHLTGLVNRRFLDNHLDRRAGTSRREDDRLAVLFLDLDDFKPVNDQYGHQVGDEVLRTIARRLRNTSREDEVVARYGGDEFVVVSRMLRTARDVSLLVERIQSAVCTPVVGVADEPITVGASIGIGIGAPGDDPADVLRRADAASYRAKRDGKNRARYGCDAAVT